MRSAITEFLEASAGVPEIDRVAVFDNDGTLWCERPSYVQKLFVEWSVSERVERDRGYIPPALLSSLSGLSIGDLAPGVVAAAINDVFAGLRPEEFAAVVTRFRRAWRHDDLGVSLLGLRYAPMLELVEALRRRAFDVFIVTGGGADFVRALAHELYGVPPDRVVGSLVGYEFNGVDLVRGTELVGPPNEGAEKVSRIQTMLGRRPIFAAGNSAGDTEMLQYALGSGTPALAVLIDHDDDEREYAYRSVAASLSDGRDIAEMGRAGGWTVVSMRHDWSTVFAHDESPER